MGCTFILFLQMINNFEHDMSQAVDALREEKEKASQALEEMKEKVSGLVL